MVQVFLILTKFMVAGIFSMVSIIFLISTIIKWKKKNSFRLSFGLFMAFGLFALLTFNIDLTSAEFTTREDSIGAFKDNFGFEPPETVENIKHKNFALYDASAHWMSFTYDSIVFEKIRLQDQPLSIADPNTNEHSQIINEFSRENPNAPEWWISPTSITGTIYYKKDFLNHTFSEYYLYRSGDMIHLMVHYFD